MGDRCYLRVEVLAKDAKQMAEILGEERVPELLAGEKLITFEIDEANYGCSRELEEAADARLTFRTANGAGGDYGHGAMVCIEGEAEEIQTTPEGDAFARIDDGVPRAEDLASVARFRALDARFEALIRG